MKNPDVNDYQNDEDGDDEEADYSECVNAFQLEDDDYE